MNNSTWRCNPKLKLHEKLQKRLAAEKNRINFLVRCKSLQLTPNFLKIKPKPYIVRNEKLKSKYFNLLSTFYLQCLNLCISDAHSQRKTIESKIIKNETKLRDEINNNDLNVFMQQLNKKTESLFNKIKTRQTNKVNKLMNIKIKSEPLVINENWLTNLTKIKIPSAVKYILSLGPKFSLPINYFPVDKIIASVEQCLINTDNENKIEIRNKVCNILTNHKNKLKNISNKTKHQINYYVKETKKFLTDNPNIFILTADKCHKTVIMYKDQYEEKITNMLSDENTYKIETQDQTKKVQNNVNNLVKSWTRKKLITEQQKNKLICHNGHTPFIYGLPKLHKENIPLRPIVSNIDSPTYNLSKFLSNTISNVLGNSEYHVKDSWQFCEFIKKQIVPNNHIIMSLDVTSLYTNIPTNLAIECINNKWPEITNYSPLTKDEFINAVSLCLNSTYFTYNNNFYSQIFGTAMGSPISATIANLVMEELENAVLKKLNYKPIFYKRYVDDCLICIPRDKIEYTINTFNDFHPRLQFTSEIEVNKTINFLDITIKHSEQGKIETNWYTKNIWSERYLNFKSHTPNRYKKSVVNSLTDHAIKLAHPKYRPENLKKIKKVLEINSYPKHFYEPIIKNRIYTIYNKNKKQPKQNNSKYISMPYIPTVSENISNILKPYNITIAHKPFNTTKKFFTKLKPELKTNDETNTIYKIDCNNCNSTYIGQSKQYLHKRIYAHKYDIRTMNNSTALTKHATEQNHSFDFENVQILKREQNYFKRSIHEMIEIKKHRNAINNRTDIENLSEIYFNLLN